MSPRKIIHADGLVAAYRLGVFHILLTQYGREFHGLWWDLCGEIWSRG